MPSAQLKRLYRAAAGWARTLLRLAYLTVTNAFAMLRLLPMSDRDKYAEILALRRLRIPVAPDTVLR
ncbi:hypothetical protein ACFYWS_25660 [Streptomyces sp. NPDC002795]|uniref:hypothetical protein n=1 Tax=Streptomyces sp. NPDC002795 TaxID=3364665 RepID=UPI00369A6128